MDTHKVWFVTGASKGLGLSLVKKLVKQGYAVAATSRGKMDLPEFKSTNFLPLQVDLQDEQSVANALKKTIEVFRKIDVIVNNAGYGQLGTLEELTDVESRKNFDVNVFGSLNVIRNVLPHLRSQKKGMIFNIASIGGLSGDYAGWGIYCATKFAM